MAQSMGIAHNLDLDLEDLDQQVDPPEMLAEVLAEKAERVESYGRRVSRLIRFCKENGIEPVILTQPALYGSGIDEVSGVDLAHVKFTTVNGATAWSVLELFNQKVRDIAASEGAFVIDLAMLLPKSTRYFYDWGHFNLVGAERVAQIVYEELCPHLTALQAKHAIAPCL